MKSKIFLSLACSIFVGLSPAAAKAVTDLGQLCSKYPSNSHCEGYVPLTIDNTVDVPSSHETQKSYEVLNTEDWRTDDDIPYSEPVIVNDPFDGDYLAVIDKNFSGSLTFDGMQSGVVTNWSERYIRVYAYFTEEDCLNDDDWFCPQFTTVRETNRLDIKIGDEIFRLTGLNGNFLVTPELAEALRTAPAGPALTRIVLEGSGEVITNEIGAGTTDAWHVVYQGSSSESVSND